MDKLIKHFDFDMERIAGDSKRETFDILRILKQLYYIEKAGKKGKKIRIIDILAKPRLANIPFVDSRSGIYNDVFRKLYDQIKEAVPDAEERHAKLEQIDRFWKFITVFSFNYVLSPQTQNTPNEAYEELLCLKDFMEHKLYDKLKDIPSSCKTHSAEIMKTFYNILECHRLLCIDDAKLTINQQILPDIIPTPAYIAEFKEAERSEEVSWEILKLIEQRLNRKTDNGDADSIIRLIAYDSELSEEEVKHCLYAIEKVQTVIHWWRDYWGLEHTDRVSVDLLCVAMQEIIWCKKKQAAGQA